MDETSPSSSTTTADQKEAAPVKQAACLNCRRSKIRCLRNADDIICRRCAQTNARCIIPDYHVGRKKGIKNKRGGLDKAVFRIEQAIKKSRSQGNQAPDDPEVIRLQNLLHEAHEALADHAAKDVLPSMSMRESGPRVNGRPSYHPDQARQPLPPVGNPAPDDNYAVDDAENPLQLLARASDISNSPFQQNHSSSFIPSASAQLQPQEPRWNDDLQTFFGPFRPGLDVGEDIDPIDLGLVTFEEVDTLFNYFYQNLAHTRWGLDQLLHTPTFVRNQSSFLFTSILAASALFMPMTSALSRRLSNHCSHLAHTAMKKRHRSPELVLAYMINIPWMSPGKHWSDDETCSYMASAMTIAVDISLNKVIIPSPSNSQATPPVAQSECITAKKALDLDGFHDVDPSSPLGSRLLRRRERVWLSLFVLDRGVCMARGRSYTVPLTPLIESCDEWHSSDIADIWDGSIISSAVLRRDLVNLVTNINDTCSRDRQITASILQDMIEGFFNRWYARWTFAIGGHSSNSIPPYVEILVTHGRLSVYSSVINHPTAPPEVKQFFRSAGLLSALNVMRAAVQGEGRLKSMPNNTVIMISFAAMICFRLNTLAANSNHSLAPSIRILIEETADVLERIGTNPSHRKGISALYGRHLREVTGTGARRQYTASEPNNTLAVGHNVMPPQTYPNHSMSRPMDVQPVQFSAMSDDQITQAIRNAEDGLGTELTSFQMDERSGLDWLDWFDMDVNT